MNAAHTQIPWEADPDPGSPSMIRPSNGIGYVGIVSKREDEAIIIKAVNNHAKLISALHDAMDGICSTDKEVQREAYAIGEALLEEIDKS